MIQVFHARSDGRKIAHSRTTLSRTSWRRESSGWWRSRISVASRGTSWRRGSVHAGVDRDPTTVARGRFLQAGLAHARLCAEVSAALTLNDASSAPERGRDALARLIAFRREHAREWIANFNHCSWVEDKSWRLPVSLTARRAP